MILKCWSIYIFSIIVVSVVGVDIKNVVCNHTESIYGVPNDLDLSKTAEIVPHLKLKECIDRCCQNSTCQAAGIHKNFCVNARCKNQICSSNLTDFTPNGRNENAEFTFLLRPDSAEILPQSETTKNDTDDVSSDSLDPQLTDSSGEKDLNTETQVTVGNNTNSDVSKSSEVENTETQEAKTPNSANTSDKENASINDKGETTPNDGATKSEDDDGGTSKAEDNAASSDAPNGGDGVCDPVCGANEICTQNSGVWKCSCKEGYIVKDSLCVEKVICKEKSCAEHSTCTVIDNAISCPCQTGYKLKEAACVEVSCDKVTCPQHASCAVADNNAKCYCDQNFIAQGVYCRQEVKCTTESGDASCPENERCKQVNNKPQCLCIPGKVRVKPGGNCTGDAASITLATEDVTATLPAHSATLSTAVSPAHKNTPNYYTYKWEQQSSPESTSDVKDGSVVAGLTKADVTISKLVAGEYVFLVSVTGQQNEFQSKVVKLVVEPAAHTNEPPVAVIKPSGNQSFKLPADFSLNGIDSTDDDKITSFAWKIDKKPVASKDHVNLEGENTDTLHVKIEAGEGEFTFKLEVTDHDGLTASATKSVTILAEDDFPPSAKVSTGIAITLPENSAVLSGKESSDDHGITRWEWQKSADSPKTGDMTGTTSDTLTLANLVEGTYTFSLTVHDRKEYVSTASTTVTVRPAQKGPPVADAGENKELIMPDRNTELDGSKSHSPLGALVYLWELVGEDVSVSLTNTNTSKLSVSGMDVGIYRFKLTVTDTTAVSDSDEVSVTVKADNNKPPVAVLGDSVVVYAPDTAIDIDGSKSTDDNDIVRWEWSRSLTSPALGQVVTGSNRKSVLKLCDLIVGEYTFTLTVYDEKGLSDSASINVTVRSNPDANDIVQVYLFEDPANFTQDRLNSLIDILMVPFRNSKQRSIQQWELVTFSVTTIDSRVVVYFYGLDESGKRMEGAPLVRHLRDTVYGKLLGFNFDIIDTSSCSNDCGGHGSCSDDTRLCTCDKFWMENVFRASAGRQFSNCQWSKIYFGIVVLAILIAFLIVIYTVYCILSLRNNQIRRKMKYRVLEEETGRGVNLSSSDEDSDVFRMKQVRKSSSGTKIGNGYMPANVLNNGANSALSNSAKKK